MNKRWHIRFKVKTWQLLLVLLPLLFLDATLLRVDHIRMEDLKKAVIKADEDGDDEAISRALEELRRFVLSNMVINVQEENGEQRIIFGTGPFDLANSYKKAAITALEAAKEGLHSDTNPNGNIYAKATAVCQPLAIANGWRWDNPNYVGCMVTEIQKYPAANEIQDKIIADLPSKELFRKNYASPIWAPTVTGFAILITLAIIVVILIRVMFWIIIRLSLLFI